MKMKNNLNFQSKGQGKPIVLLHGYLENALIWDAFVDALVVDYQVICIDLPGHGGSEVYDKVHTMEFMAEKVKEVLDELNVESAFFAGHSMGGYVVLALAELFPKKVNDFILINSSTLADDESTKELRSRMMEIADRNFELMIKFILTDLFIDAHRFQNEKKNLLEMALSTSVEGAKAALAGMRLRKDRNFMLDEFSGKIGIVNGEFDAIIDVASFEKAVPKGKNIKMLTVKSRHYAFIEAFEEVLQMMCEMLRD